MNNIIYQYWKGPMKSGVVASTKLMKEYADKKPLFGIEQEFFIFHKDIEHNVNLEYADKKPQGNYYCGVGGNNISSTERKCIEEI